MEKPVKQRPKAPTTTSEEDIVTRGQRRINMIWEMTQALVALVVTAAFIYMEVKGIQTEAIKMAFALVIGFYFSRTNHTAIGGVGKKAIEGRLSRR